MISFVRRIAVLLLACAALCASASTSYSTDYTDLWGTPNESGHGMYIVQNGNTLFVSIFVYGGDTLPRWYFASAVTPVNNSTTSFSGILYRSVGTSFAAPWNPSSFTPIAVGTLSLLFTSPSQGTLSYTVDSVAVTQAIARVPFAPINLSGTYMGGALATPSQCSIPATIFFITDRLTVQHTPPGDPKFTVDFNPGTGPATCVFTGAYTQLGRIGAIPNGTWSCTGATNSSGSFSMTEIEVTQNGLSAKFNGRDAVCQSLVGYFGGVRDPF